MGPVADRSDLALLGFEVVKGDTRVTRPAPAGHSGWCLAAGLVGGDVQVVEHGTRAVRSGRTTGAPWRGAPDLCQVLSATLDEEVGVIVGADVL